jgi:hypothetical protein
MHYWGVWVGSYIVKNMTKCLKFLKKMEQCGTFEGK